MTVYLIESMGIREKNQKPYLKNLQNSIFTQLKEIGIITQEIHTTMEDTNSLPKIQINGFLSEDAWPKEL